MKIEKGEMCLPEQLQGGAAVLSLDLFTFFQYGSI